MDICIQGNKRFHACMIKHLHEDNGWFLLSFFFFCTHIIWRKNKRANVMKKQMLVLEDEFLGIRLL